jgi:hypothetical protein
MMIQLIRRHVTYANVVMTLALVFAMAGGAFAVTSRDGGRHATAIAAKKAKPKSKGLRGPAGPRGPQGPAGPEGKQGPVGPQGPAGAKGENGSNGTIGTNGKDGATGKSVTVGVPSASECQEGGATVEVESTSASKKKICNGSPWTAGGTLPHNASEKGMFTATNVGVNAGAKGHGYGAISFGIPLASAPVANYIGPGATHTTGTGELSNESAVVKNVTTSTGQFARGEVISGSGIPANATIKQVISSTELRLSAEATASGTGVSLTANLPAACPGSFAAPTATSGNLCLYGESEAPETLAFEEFANVSPVGALVLTEVGISGETLIGTWAVTG